MTKDEKYDGHYDGYIALAAAILRAAADDYIEALQSLESVASKSNIIRSERFFRSDWGQILSFNHGEYIIRECRRIAEEKRQQQKAKVECDKMKRKQ